MYIKWIDEKNSHKLYVSSKLLQEQDILAKRMIVHFGSRAKEMVVHCIEDRTESYIKLPKQLFQHLTLPTHLPYEVRIEGRNIFIGPVVAFIPFAKVTKKQLTSLEEYFCDYQHVKGLIFICSADSFNLKDKTVTGYYYDPSNQQHWCDGIFPYPNAIYRKLL